MAGNRVRTLTCTNCDWCVSIPQEMLVRLIECNDVVMAADVGDDNAMQDLRGAEGGTSGSASGGSSAGDDGEPDGPATDSISMLFSTESRRIMYLAETLQAFVSMASQLPAELLDEMVLLRLGDLVEQLVFAFPTLTSNNFGAR